MLTEASQRACYMAANVSFHSEQLFHLSYVLFSPLLASVTYINTQHNKLASEWKLTGILTRIYRFITKLPLHASHTCVSPYYFQNAISQHVLWVPTKNRRLLAPWGLWYEFVRFLCTILSYNKRNCTSFLGYFFPPGSLQMEIQIKRSINGISTWKSSSSTF